MRFYHIALFLFIFQTFGAIFTDYAPYMGLNATLYIDKLTPQALQQVEEIKQEVAPEEELTATDPIQAALGWFYQQLSNIANRLFSATFPLIRYVAWIPFYLMAIGVPSEFAWGIFSVVMIIQVIGFFEFVTGRPIEK